MVNLRSVTFEENHALLDSGSALYFEATVGGHAKDVRFVNNTGIEMLRRALTICFVDIKESEYLGE